VQHHAKSKHAVEAQGAFHRLPVTRDTAGFQTILEYVS
jgi:hypothetical protein